MRHPQIVPILLCIGLLTTSLQAYSGGAGTAEDPYQIATPEDLIALGDTPDHYNKHFLLTADIDLSGHTFTQAVIAPDSDSSESNFQGDPFLGVFDGASHVICHLRIGGQGYLGLFGYVGTKAVVRNVILEDVLIEGTSGYLGGLAGCSYEGYVSNCSSGGEVIGSYFPVGGLLGASYEGKVSNCCSHGVVTGQVRDVGGLIGSNVSSVMSCYSTCVVKGQARWVGGLIGSNFTRVWACYSTGEITGNRDVGGLVGYNLNGKVLDCYSTATVEGEYEVAGLVGYNSGGTVLVCYSVGVVTGDSTVGGLVALNSGSVRDSFWDVQVSGLEVSDGGVGLTTSEMLDVSLYLAAGWDFVGEIENGVEDIWLIEDAQGYPFLPYAGRITPHVYSGGDGTAGDPYQIASLADFIHLSKTPDDYDKHFVLTTDIDLSGHVFNRAVIAPGDCLDESTVWVRPGHSFGEFDGVPFTGSFCGNGHVIRNFWIEADDFWGQECLGLFGCLASTAVVSDLGIEDESIQTSYCLVGCLAGYNNGCVSNCYCVGEVVEGAQSYGYIGGLIGFNTGHISDCQATCILTSAVSYTGGLVAYSEAGWIHGCHSTTTITSHWTTGGLVGYNDRGQVWDCSSEAQIVEGAEAIGGLLGGNDRGHVWHCSSHADIQEPAGWAGGLVGENFYGSIWGSYSEGEVAGQGGLVGHNYDGTVSNCYSTAAVTGQGTCGGLIGHNDGRVLNSFSAGCISEGAYRQGLIGQNAFDWSGMSLRGIVENCFWDVEASGVTGSRGGVGLTTTEMQDIDTFLDAGWDFQGEAANGTAQSWKMSEEGGYPQLDLVGSVTLAGAGTEQEPFLITNAKELGAVRYRPLAHYRLETDIDLSATTFSGAVVPWFGGYFDGNGHVLRQLNIRGGDMPALFGYLDANSVVENLGLADGSIEGRDTYVGSLAGYSEGTVRCCYNTSAIHAESGYSGGFGGLIGYNSGALLDCYNTGAVVGEDNYIGGLIGYNIGDVSRCYVAALVTGGLTATSRGGGGGGVIEGGGLFGYNSGEVVDSFWDTEFSGITEDRGGTGLTTAQMQAVETYLAAGWDFVDETDNGTEDLWWMAEGDYPRLWWETSEGQ